MTDGQIGIGTPLARRPSLTTVRTDRVYGGSAGEVGEASQGASQTGLWRLAVPSPQSIRIRARQDLPLFAATIYHGHSTAVRSARIFASGVAVPFGHCHAGAWPVALRAALPAPLAEIRLPSATLRGRTKMQIEVDSFCSFVYFATFFDIFRRHAPVVKLAYTQGSGPCGR